MRPHHKTRGLGPTAPRVSGALVLVTLLLIGCSTGAAGNSSTSQASANTEATMAIQPPPIDREAPAEYQTATFAFG